MSFEDLQKELDKLSGAVSSPVAIFSYKNLRFHLRDLDAEEGMVASEYSYLEVEESLRGPQLNKKPSDKNFSQSMRAAHTYRIATIALAIRRIEMLDGDKVKNDWNVDVRPNEIIKIGNDEFPKFEYFIDMINKWGKDLPGLMYDRFAELRQQSEELVENKIYVEDSDSPPKSTEATRFSKVAEEKSLETDEGEVAKETERLSKLKAKEDLDNAST